MMIPLAVRSHYSFMWGTADPERICAAARSHGYTRIGMVDTDNLCGLWPFLAACKRHGITPIVGAEVTAPDASKRVLCLVENLSGYQNLCRLLTRRHMDEPFSLEEALIRFGEGLVILTQNPELLSNLKDAGLYVAGAMPRKPLHGGHPLRQAAKRLSVPVVAVPGSFFLSPGDWSVHRTLRAIDRNLSFSRLDPKDVAPLDAWLASPDEYRRRFEICPEALKATEEIAERLTFTGPDFGTVLPPWEGSDGKPADVVLRELAYAGAKERYGPELSRAVVDRMEHELQIIGQMGFPSYFLIVREIVARSPRTCGRGSGAASLVAYCLKITNVCPIKHNLYFERFLNPGRLDPPDIDVDFAWDERSGVLSHVLSRFKGHVAMVSNHVTLQPRMAVREVAKVYGLTDAEIGRVLRRMPMFWQLDDADTDMAAVLQERPESRYLEFPAPWPEIMAMAAKIVGVPRYLSVHPGGVVITPEPIDSYVPIQMAPKGVPIVQWEKEGVETAGLVKIDLLGNRSLGVIRDAVANVKANHEPFDESRWEPEDDPATRREVAEGRTMGCFYIESPAMRLLQKKAGKGDFEHLVIHSSIIRPAANNYIQQYLERLHGAPWEPIHPLLYDVLGETFGIMVYQEDVSRVATALAGFSGADADRLRKIISKKDRVYVLKDFYARFQEGAIKRGVSEQQVIDIWNMMLSFDGYSFCKPHSASYARVSFQAAYLKTHFPAEFMAAVISNQGGFYSAFAYVSEARRLGISILPPDVNQSQSRWGGQNKSIRVGLLSIKGLSEATQRRMVLEREKRSFKSMNDFFRRVEPAEDEARQLIACGALDAFSPSGNRAQLMWGLAQWQAARRVKSGSLSLFDDGEASLPPPCLPPDDLRTRLRNEFSVLGFLCDRHPMSLFAEKVKKMGCIPASTLSGHIGRRVRICGWLITGKKVHTKHGDAMEFITFEDDTGLVETTFFPETYNRFCHLLDWGRPYLISGIVEENWGAVTLTVEGVAPLT